MTAGGAELDGILDHADELADRFEAFDASAATDIPVQGRGRTTIPEWPEPRVGNAGAAEILARSGESNRPSPSDRDQRRCVGLSNRNSLIVLHISRYILIAQSLSRPSLSLGLRHQPPTCVRLPERQQ